MNLAVSAAISNAAYSVHSPIGFDFSERSGVCLLRHGDQPVAVTTLPSTTFDNEVELWAATNGLEMRHLTLALYETSDRSQIGTLYKWGKALIDEPPPDVRPDFGITSLPRIR